MKFVHVLILALTLFGAQSALASDTAVVNSAAPTYTDHTVQPMTMGTDSSVRVQQTDGAGNTVGTSGNPEYIQGSVSTTPASPSTATGTITTTQCVQLTGLQAQATVGVSITGTMSAGGIAGFKTVTTTYPAAANATLRAQPVGTTGSGTTVTAIGSFTVDTAGMQQFEVCGNNTFSGSAVVTLRTTTAGETSIDGFGILAGTTATPSAATVSTVDQPSAASTSGLAPVPSTVTEASHVLKASAGNLYDLSVTNGATAGYLLLYNATSAPSDGAVTPVKCYAMPATSSTMAVAFDAAPAYFSTGITAVYSSTGCFTQTASATAYISGGVK